jgi:hypothetical protein
MTQLPFCIAHDVFVKWIIPSVPYIGTAVPAEYLGRASGSFDCHGFEAAHRIAFKDYLLLGEDQLEA